MTNNSIVKRYFTKLDKSRFPECNNEEYLEVVKHPLGFYVSQGYMEITKIDTTGTYYKWIPIVEAKQKLNKGDQE